MDANGMFHRANLIYEGGKLFNRTFNTREWSDFFNLAQTALLKERYAAWKNRPQMGYGANEVRDSELAGLQSGTKRINRTKFIKGTMDNGALPNPDRDASVVLNGNEATYPSDIFGVFAPLPDECVYPTYEYVALVDSSNNVSWNIPVKNVTRDQYYRGIYDKYAQPYNDLVWSMDWGTFTTSEFDATSGVFTPSAKDYSQTGSGTNMTGTNMQFTAQIDTTTTSVLNNQYYVSSGSVTYNGTEYTAGSWFTAIDASEITITTAILFQYTPTTVNINTIRSKYLLQPKDYQVLEYAVQYIKLPRDIVVNLVTPANQVSCELAPFLHEEIVQKAVKIAAQSIIPEPNKYQVNQMEDTINE